MTTQPLVTIGVPVYNEERYLPEALDSLLAQDYGNLEVIILDNGSTDRTAEICHEYASKDARVRCNQEPTNRGAAYSFEQTFRLARGKYFTWASGHDMRAPSGVRKCVEVLEANPDMVLCYPKTLLLDFYGGQPEEMNWDTLETTGLGPGRRFRHVVMRLTKGNAVYGVFRATALERIRMPQAIMWSDVVLLSELSFHGSFHQIDDRLFLRRRNRPPESQEEHRARAAAMMNPGNPRAVPRFPNLLKMWDLMKVCWRGPFELPFRLGLMAKVAYWVAVPASARIVYQRLPRLRPFYRRHPAFRQAWFSFRERSVDDGEQTGRRGVEHSAECVSPHGAPPA
jgi:hypothetical protein